MGWSCRRAVLDTLLAHHHGEHQKERRMVENEELHDEHIYTEAERNGLVNVLTKEETWEMFDRQARCYFDMSGEEFICAWESGEFDDDPDGPNVMWVAMMIPLVK
jgi:hypothetical protein